MTQCARCGADLPAEGGDCASCGAREGTPQAQVVAGKYQLTKLIGRGGMGTVHLATDLSLERICALKMLRPSLASEEDIVTRFEKEARMLARLEHPNVVPIYAVDRADGVPFIVMKFLEGKTFSQVRRDQGRPWTAQELTPLLKQLCAGLGFMHSKGVVHRDLKPGNLFISSEGHLTILDLGIARTLDSTLTRPGLPMGTPHYMSPEQTATMQIDARSDLYSLGVILFEAVTGRLPFVGESEFDLMRAHRETPPPDAAEHVRLSPLVGKLLQRAMAKAPLERYQSPKEFLEAWEVAAASPVPDKDPKGTTTNPMTPRPITATPSSKGPVQATPAVEISRPLAPLAPSPTAEAKAEVKPEGPVSRPLTPMKSADGLLSKPLTPMKSADGLLSKPLTPMKSSDSAISKPLTPMKSGDSAISKPLTPMKVAASSPAPAPALLGAISKPLTPLKPEGPVSRPLTPSRTGPSAIASAPKSSLSSGLLSPKPSAPKATAPPTGVTAAGDLLGAKPSAPVAPASTRASQPLPRPSPLAAKAPATDPNVPKAPLPDEDPPTPVPDGLGRFPSPQLGGDDDFGGKTAMVPSPMVPSEVGLPVVGAKPETDVASQTLSGDEEDFSDDKTNIVGPDLQPLMFGASAGVKPLSLAVTPQMPALGAPGATIDTTGISKGDGNPWKEQDATASTVTPGPVTAPGEERARHPTTESPIAQLSSLLSRPLVLAVCGGVLFLCCVIGVVLLLRTPSGTDGSSIVEVKPSQKPPWKSDLPPDLPPQLAKAAQPPPKEAAKVDPSPVTPPPVDKTDDPPPRRKERAANAPKEPKESKEKEPRPAKAKTGEVRVVALAGGKPVSAKVTIDGVDKGHTPLVIQLSTGSHDVTVSRSSGAPVAKLVKVSGDKPLVVKIELPN